MSLIKVSLLERRGGQDRVVVIYLENLNFMKKKEKRWQKNESCHLLKDGSSKLTNIDRQSWPIILILPLYLHLMTNEHWQAYFWDAVHGTFTNITLPLIKSILWKVGHNKLWFFIKRRIYQDVHQNLLEIRFWLFRFHMLFLKKFRFDISHFIKQPDFFVQGSIKLIDWLLFEGERLWLVHLNYFVNSLKLSVITQLELWYKCPPDMFKNARDMEKK